MTILEYLLLKNTLNLQLSIALEKFNILCIRGNQNDICGAVCDTNIIKLETDNLYKGLAILDVCYNKGLSLEKTVEKIGFGLLPQK